MALTLLEASKRNSGEIKRAGVIEMFAQSSDIMGVLPFVDIAGGSLAYTLEGKLPGVAFRGYNEGYTASYGILNPQVEILRIAGGELDVDRAIIKTRGEGVREDQERMKVKALGLHITSKIIKGDSEANPREFDGLRKRITGSQLIQGKAGAAGDGPLSLERLDEAIDAVDAPTHLIMSKGMRRKLTTAARAGVGGDIQYTTDAFGRRQTVYNDLPILIADYDDAGARIMAFDEIGPSAGSNVCQSIYVASFGSDKLVGLQNGVMDVRDLGEIDSLPVMRTRVEWLVSLAAMHGRSAARVWGITDAAVTA